MIELYREIELKMKHTVDHFHNELKHLRLGRASLGMFEGISADYYGTQTPIQQLANFTVADPTLIVAQPFDPSTIAAIERAIIKSDLGLNPSNDGRVLRIPVPTLTEERRHEIVKKVHDSAEGVRNGIRQARREGNDRLKAKEKAKEISQDEERRGNDEMQKLHDHYIAEINEAVKHKEGQILEI